MISTYPCLPHEDPVTHSASSHRLTLRETYQSIGATLSQDEMFGFVIQLCNKDD